MQTRTLYQMLNVSEQATTAEIKHTYEEKLAEFTQAYDILLNPAQRLKYDKELLLESIEEEKKEVISHPVKQLHFDPHATIPIPFAKLMTTLANNNIIIVSTSQNWHQFTNIYKIDVDKEPPSSPLLRVDGCVVSIASESNNQFVVGTTDGDIFVISAEGDILFHKKNLTGSDRSHSIENLRVFDHGKSLMYQTRGFIYILSDFMNNDIPIKVKSNSNVHHSLILNDNDRAYLITTCENGIEVRDTATLDVLSHCRVPNMDPYNSRIYFIEPIASHPGEFYIAYDRAEPDHIYYPVIVKGNIHTLSTKGLETISELKILNKDKPCRDRFGVFQNEILQLLPDGHVIARKREFMGLINIDDPDNIKKIPSSIKGSGGLAILHDGRVVELVSNINGDYQCFTFKRIHDYFAKLALLKSEVLPSILPGNANDIVTGYLESHDPSYYGGKSIESKSIHPAKRKRIDHLSDQSELLGRAKAFITYSNKIPDAKWIISEADDILFEIQNELHQLELIKKTKTEYNLIKESIQAIRKNALIKIEIARGVPAAFICPLTGKKLQDPVVCEDGLSYERKAIEVFHRQHPAQLNIVSQHNFALKSLIEEFDKDPAVLKKPLTVIDELLCGISQTVLFAPIITTSGKTYEEQSLNNWIKIKEQARDPITRGEINPKVSNVAIKNFIKQYLEENPRYLIKLFQSEWEVTLANQALYIEWVHSLNWQETKKAELITMIGKLARGESIAEKTGLFFKLKNFSLDSAKQPESKNQFYTP